MDAVEVFVEYSMRRTVESGMVPTATEGKITAVSGAELQISLRATVEYNRKIRLGAH